MIYGEITNCSVVGHGTITAYECRLGYEIISENTSKNTRQIKLQLEARTTNSRYTTTGWKLTPTIDGVELSSIGMNFSSSNVNNWETLGSRIITITGSFNGTKTGSFTTNVPNEWGLKSGSASVTIVLTDLHMPPVITNVEITERNSLLNNYTGIAQHLSVKNITLDASTYDDATISSYQVHHNGALIGSSSVNGMTINFDDVGTLATFEMNGKTYCTLKFVVIDSYGTSGFKEEQIEVTQYTKPNLVQTSSNVKRNGQITGKVKLNLIGAFFNQSVNAIQNIISLKFAYWKKGDPESTTYHDIPFEAADNNIDLYEWHVVINDEEITDVDKDYAYNFKIKATDNFGRTSEITLLCPVGEYLWAEFKDRVDFKNITIQNQKVSSSFLLYEDSQGSNDSVPLSASKSNFSKLKILAKSNGSVWQTVEIPTNTDIFRISIIDNNGSGMDAWFKQNTYSLNDNEITFESGFWRNINGNISGEESAITIYEVLGYK